jgi:hypothetical protein
MMWNGTPPRTSSAGRRRARHSTRPNSMGTPGPSGKLLLALEWHRRPNRLRIRVRLDVVRLHPCAQSLNFAQSSNLPSRCQHAAGSPHRDYPTPASSPPPLPPPACLSIGRRTAISQRRRSQRGLKWEGLRCSLAVGGRRGGTHGFLGLPPPQVAVSPESSARSSHCLSTYPRPQLLVLLRARLTLS